MSCFYYYRFLTMNLAAVQIQQVVVFALASCVFFPFVAASAFIIFPVFPALIHIYFFFVYGFQLFFISLLLATSGPRISGVTIPILTTKAAFFSISQSLTENCAENVSILHNSHKTLY